MDFLTEKKKALIKLGRFYFCFYKKLLIQLLLQITDGKLLSLSQRECLT